MREVNKDVLKKYRYIDKKRSIEAVTLQLKKKVRLKWSVLDY
ncbi:hypothetical protein [Bizionia sp. M204]|nr:hypothetical protein [Bizionia sp. M204]